MSFLNDLKETINEDFNESVTENGAIGYRTTEKYLLDMNFLVSSMRGMEEDEIVNMFSKTFYENKLLAIKWLFYVADVRGGLGERRLFRICFKYLASEHEEIAKRLLNLIPEYTRWDNLIILLEDKLLVNDIICIIKNQLTEDIHNMKNNKPVSLLAKWMPSINTSSNKTKNLARIIINKLRCSKALYRKTLSSLRKYLKIVEVYMCAKEWGSIDYSAVPSRANLFYNNAFLRNDKERRELYLDSLQKGETKINASVLFPHDIVSKYSSKYDITLEELWKSLPDFVNGNGKTICVADGSGSMNSKIPNTKISCLDVANSLAIYFSERCSGEFKDNYITFSNRPQLVDLSNANSLKEKIVIAKKYCEVSDTDIQAVFTLILGTAINKNLKQEDIPDNILILSDMEFNSCTEVGCYDERINKRLFQYISDSYKLYGYKLPRIIFWNIYSRSKTIPIKENELGVTLVSGFSPNIVKMVLSNKLDQFECLLEQLNSERYYPIEKAIIDKI